MKSTCLLLLTVACLLITGGNAPARLVRIWSYQELLDKSDLAVIAAPTVTNDTREHINLPGFSGQLVIGLETEFAVSAVLKGDKTQKQFVLHHYRAAGSMMVPNGPTLISFAISDKPWAITKKYILFLVREADGRYASVVGQLDPGLGIKELNDVGSSPAQTK